ncbi:hypothetical protein BGZ72_005535 [Mortierella alpina]|nr:hypothetical protein BGZ72_005535 [Mortierella alpina]
MKVATIAITFLAVVCTATLAAPVPDDLVDVNVQEVEVGQDGSIVNVKPTDVSVAKEGEGLAHIETEGVGISNADTAGPQIARFENLSGLDEMLAHAQ